MIMVGPLELEPGAKGLEFWRESSREIRSLL